MSEKLTLVDGAVHESRDGTAKYRTVVTGTEKSTHNNLYCVCFDTSKLDENGEIQYIAYSASSAKVFETEAEALEAGKRALKALAETGKYPNMCEKF